MSKTGYRTKAPDCIITAVIGFKGHVALITMRLTVLSLQIRYVDDNAKGIQQLRWYMRDDFDDLFIYLF